MYFFDRSQMHPIVRQCHGYVQLIACNFYRLSIAIQLCAKRDSMTRLAIWKKGFEAIGKLKKIKEGFDLAMITKRFERKGRGVQERTKKKDEQMNKNVITERNKR